MKTVEAFNQRLAGFFPAHLGIVFTSVEQNAVCAEFRVQPHLMAPNGYLHGGAVVSLADTCAGFACFANLPEGASGYTTAELKMNFVGTAMHGTIACVASPVHLGRSTQVWDAKVTHVESGRTLGVFRCTQMILRT